MKKVIKNIIIPVIITSIIIYFFFKDISVSDIKNALLNIPFAILTVFILLHIIATFLRALKYHILVSKKIRFIDIFIITLVRNFSVDLLPARSASLVFYSYLTKKKGLSVEEGASSFIVSMFYDVLSLSLMLGGLLFFLQTGINKFPFYAGIITLFIVSTVMIFFSDNILGFVLNTKTIEKFQKIKRIFKNIHDYLTEHRTNSERLSVFFISFFIRIIKYVSIYILFLGIIKTSGSLSNFSKFSFGIAGTELSSLIPIQGIGGFGTWELAFSFIFDALNISAGNSRLTALVIHITSQVWEYFIGITAFLYIFINIHLKNKKAE